MKTGILKYRAVTETDVFVLLRTKIIIKFQSLDAYARVAVSEDRFLPRPFARQFITPTAIAYTAPAAEPIVSRIITK